jgi:hypothetical protein
LVSSLFAGRRDRGRDEHVDRHARQVVTLERGGDVLVDVVKGRDDGASALQGELDVDPVVS